jgi:hypothetical protein
MAKLILILIGEKRFGIKQIVKGVNEFLTNILKIITIIGLDLDTLKAT